LLSLPPHAASVVALITIFAIMGISAFIGSRKQVSGGSLLAFIGGVAGVAMVAGGVAILAVGPPKPEVKPAKPQVLALVAPVGAASKGFDPTTLSATPAAPIQIVLDNQDPNVPHNVAVFATDPAKDTGATPLASVPQQNGPTKLTLNVGTLKAGTYYFICQVHPSTMQGTLEVAEAGGASDGASGGASGASGTPTASAGGGSGAVSLSAQNIAFSTNTLSFPAGQAVTLTFDNKDAGVPHNVSIWSDQGYTKSVFTGEQITGPTSIDYKVPALPAGTYYFRCDVHPTTMNGTITVG
jgi:plastocyanin